MTRAGRTAKVVGILAPTGTSMDAAVFVPRRPAEPIITAIVIVPGHDFDAAVVSRVLNEPGIVVVPVEPALRRLVGLVAAVEQIVDWLSWSIAALTFILLMSSYYASLRDRVRDLAVLRVLGARPITVVMVLGFEAAIVGVTGGVFGLLVADSLLSAARSGLSAAGFAFRSNAMEAGPRIAAAGVLVAIVAGVAAAANVYRMDPVRAIAGVHRPWPEILGQKAQARLRRSVLFAMAFLAICLPSATYTPSPSGRLPDEASMRLFGLLRRWDGGGRPASEIAALDGKNVEIEGFQYVVFDHGSKGRWRSSFFLVSDSPNRPVELFHDDSEHHPAVNERIAVELVEPIEATLYPIRVKGRLVVRKARTQEKADRVVAVEATQVLPGAPGVELWTPTTGPVVPGDELKRARGTSSTLVKGLAQSSARMWPSGPPTPPWTSGREST